MRDATLELSTVACASASAPSPPRLPPRRAVSPVSLDSFLLGGVSAPAAAPSASSPAAVTAKKQDEARKALENALGHKRTEFEKWGVEVERRQQRGRPGGPAGGGGGWSGGGGWFRWLTSGGFWDAAKQTVLTILGIIAAFFLIANFSALIAAVVNSLLVVLRQIRRALSFIAQCVYQGASVPRSGPKSSNLDNGNMAGVPVKDGVRMSAKDRVLRKWGVD